MGLRPILCDQNIFTFHLVSLEPAEYFNTMSISTGLYPNLDLWNANKLHYIRISAIVCMPTKSNPAASCSNKRNSLLPAKF